MSAYSDRIVADGASHYWRLNETSGTTVTASVGSAHGTMGVGVTLNQPGAITDGTPSMAMSGAPGFPITTGPITLAEQCSVEAWVKRSPTATQRAYFGCRPSMPVILGVNPSGYLFVYALGFLTGTTLIGTGWRHVVVVFRDPHTPTGFPGDMTIYLDGVVEVAGGPGGHIGTFPVLGGDGGDGAIAWLGGLDEVAVYPTALTPAQIANHYTLGITPVVAGRTTNDLNTGLSNFLPGTGDLTTRITAYLATLTGDSTARWKQMEKDAGF